MAPSEHDSVGRPVGEPIVEAVVDTVVDIVVGVFAGTVADSVQLPAELRGYFAQASSRWFSLIRILCNQVV